MNFFRTELFRTELFRTEHFRTEPLKKKFGSEKVRHKVDAGTVYSTGKI